VIRLTRLTDYGIVLLTHVASAREGAVHNARQLAEDTHLPLPMVGKVLKTLARRGVLQSHRGAKGGYSLVRGAAEVSLREIIAALEGPIAITDCLAPAPSECEHEATCPAQGHWRRINEVVARALDGVTLADMASPLPRAAPRLVQVEVAAPSGADRGLAGG
jgi:FeS assembly SUF system regulator